MKGKYSLMVLAMMVCLVSCNKFYPGSRAAIGKKLLTGECLASAEMSYNEVYRSTMVNENRFIFGFSLDLSDYEHETIRFMEYRYIPSDDIFKSFGKNRKAVKNAFETIFDRCDNDLSRKHRDFSVVTILYDGGISLTANKEFAGYPAGEDLAPAIEDVEAGHFHPEWYLAENVGTIFEIPLDYLKLLDMVISFSIPMEQYQLTDEKVTFELNVPVKVVKYLTWLNDKITDPDAPVPYEEEVLHCRFTTDYGLR